MQVTWNFTLVLVSILVAIVGSFTALTHAQRMRESSGRAANIWMAAGALTLGLAIWAMHFIGMLAFHLPIELNFDVTYTLLSALPAVAATFLGFYELRQPVVTTPRIFIAGIVMGAGIALMHYTGMAALKMSPSIVYNSAYFVLSIAVAVVAAWGALLMMYRGEQIKLPAHLRFIIGSIVMGIAISGMHYTAMQGLTIPLGSVCLVGGTVIDHNILAMLVSLTSLIWFGGGGIAALFDQRIAHQNAEAFLQLRMAHAALEKSANEKALEMTKELRASEAKANTIINATIDCIITLDGTGNIVEFNPAAVQTFGYSRESVLGKPYLMLIPPRFHAERIAAFVHYLSTGESDLFDSHTEQIALSSDDNEFPVEVSLVAIKIEGVQFFTGFLRDITARKKAEADIHNLAFYDLLTKLPNRRLMQDRLQHALTSSVRHNQYAAIAFIDLDNFKTLNDTRGHGIGDLLLIEAAARLRNCVRTDDTVARLGGDEFVVILEGLNENLEQAAVQVKAICEKISLALNQPYTLQAQEHFSTSSMGICLFRHQMQSQDLTVEELLKRADTAMYQAKQAGRNTMRFFDPAMQADLEARSLLEQDLRQALTQEQFELHYQPQVDGSNQIVGAEALLRWAHPIRGAVSPAQFIPIAEESGLILTIGHWVLETACKQLKAWQDNPNTADLQLAVNISSRQFLQPNFVEQVQLILHETGASAEKLKMELTESMVLDNVEDSIDKMLTLLNLGIRFSMDDFGTGYSSLTYLKRLPLSQLKIDKSFIHDVALDPNDEAIIKTIIGMAHTLGIEVVAEGVETKAQHEFLLLNGCQLFQGYLFSKATDIEAFNLLVQSGFDPNPLTTDTKPKLNPALH